MSPNELKTLLDEVPDTLEIVLRGAARRPERSLALDAWRDAHEEAASVWRAWRGRPGDPAAYAAYRAAADREDAAQDTLAHTQVSRIRVA
jgi:hypothetical protein